MELDIYPAGVYSEMEGDTPMGYVDIFLRRDK